MALAAKDIKKKNKKIKKNKVNYIAPNVCSVLH
jgi:hypothetical protein